MVNKSNFYLTGLLFTKLGVQKIISLQPYIDFKRFNDNNVKAKYYVKCSKILFLRFNKSTFTARLYCKNYEFRMLDDNKMGIVTSKFIILQFKDTIKFTHYSDERMAKWQSFGYS